MYTINVTLNILMMGKEMDKDLLIFPSYTSHTMQLLDFSVFKHFKIAFRVYQDI